MINILYLVALLFVLQYVSALTNSSICPTLYTLEYVNTSVPDLGYTCIYNTTTTSTTQYCPPGTYNDIDTDICISCPSGSYCTGITNSSLSAISTTTLCPAGMYSFSGASQCTICGSSAYSSSGSSTCTCYGLQREYQYSDHSCLCIGGYDYYDSSNNLYTGDSTGDCIPIVYSTCNGNRDSYGNCIASPAQQQAYCTASCGNTNYTYSSSLNTCECTSIPIDLQCDATCRENEISKITILPDNTDKLHIITGSTINDTLLSTLNYYGNISCNIMNGCTVQQILINSTGQYGIYGLLPAIAAAVNMQPATLSYIHPSVCINVGESIIWQFDSAGHYPIYAKDNLLNSNGAIFDYGLFRSLQSYMNTDISVNINLFGYTFNSFGTYVFADSSNPYSTAVVTVLPQSVSCPSSSTITAPNVAIPVYTQSSLYMTQMNVIPSPIFNTSPDISIVWILIGIFIGVSIFIVIFTRIKLNRTLHSVSDEPNDMEQQKQKNDFKQLYIELREYKKLNQLLFDGQQAVFRAECDRICAEAEQIKALVATKLTDGKGYIDAAYQLLLHEITARSSYVNRQKRRENELFNLLSTFTTMLYNNNSIQSANTLYPTIDSIQNKSAELIKQSQIEKQRKSHLSSNSGIIGDEIITCLCVHQHQYESIESVFIDKIQLVLNELRTFQSKLVDNELEYDERYKSLWNKQNINGIELLKSKHQKKLQNESNHVSERLTSLLSVLGDLFDQLKLCRESIVEDENNAIEIMEQKQQDNTQNVQTGLFRGVEPELAEAIKFFLLQTKASMLPGDDSSSIHDINNHTDHTGSSNLTNEQKHMLDEKQNQLVPSNILQSTEQQVQLELEQQMNNEFMNALNMDDIHHSTSGESTGDSVTAEQLQELYDKMHRREQLLDELQSREHDRSRQLAESLLASGSTVVTSVNDQIAISRAENQLNELLQKQRDNEYLIREKLKAEEFTRVHDTLHELQSMEQQITEKKHKLDDAYYIQNESIQNEQERIELEEQHTAVLAQLDQQLKSVQSDTKQQLAEIHDEMRQKLKQEKKQLTQLHQDEYNHAVNELQQIKQSVEQKHMQHDIGMDLSGQTADLLLLGTTGHITGKQQAMQQYHIQTQQELAKRHQHELQQIHNDIQIEQQLGIESIDQSIYQQQSNSVEPLQQKLIQVEDKVKSSGSTDETNRLLTEYKQQISTLESAYEAERQQQKYNLQQQLHSKQLRLQRELQQKQSVELQHELAEQTNERFALESQLLHKKELQLLQPLCTADNRHKARNIIEKIVKTRQQKESAQLLQQQYKHTNNELNAYLTQTMNQINAERQLIESRVESGDMTQEEANQLYNELDERIQPDVMNQHVLSIVEPVQLQQRTQLKSQQWDEVKQLFLRFYPDENINSIEWLQPVYKSSAELLAELKLHELNQNKLHQEQQEAINSIQHENQLLIEQMKQDKINELNRLLAEESERLEQQFNERLADEKHKQQQIQQERLAGLHNGDLVEQQSTEQHQRDVFHEKLERRHEQLRLAELQRIESEYHANLQQQQLMKQQEYERLQQQQSAVVERRNELIQVVCSTLVKHGRLYNDAKNTVMDQFIRKTRSMLDKLHDNGIELRMVPDSNGNEIPVGVYNGNTDQHNIHTNNIVIDGVTYTSSTVAAIPVIPGLTILAPNNLLQQQHSNHSTTPNNNGNAAENNTADRLNGIQLSNNSVLPYVTRLDQLESTLVSLSKTHDGLFAAHQPVVPYKLQLNGAAQQLHYSTEPKCADITQLTATQCIQYQHALYIVHLLCQHHNLLPIELCLASSIPHNQPAPRFAENRFHTLFYYDNVSRKLYVRIELFTAIQYSNPLMIVLIHTISHIQCNQWSDRNQLFVDCYDESLSVCNYHLLSHRLQNTNEIIDELINRDTLCTYDDVALQSRLSQYSVLQRNQPIKSHLTQPSFNEATKLLQYKLENTNELYVADLNEQYNNIESNQNIQKHNLHEHYNHRIDTANHQYLQCQSEISSLAQQLQSSQLTRQQTQSIKTELQHQVELQYMLQHSINTMENELYQKQNSVE